MKQRAKPLVTTLMMVLIIVSLYYGGHIHFDRKVIEQVEAFNSINEMDAHSEADMTAGGRNSDARLHFGQIRPIVVDGFSEEPLAGAVVVIPETGQRFVTGEDGATALIQVPIIEDQHFKDIAPKPWGEVTLIVYKEGYIDYVLFYTHVWENQTREGPKILLFPQPEGEPAEPFPIVEGPHRLWVNKLVDKFRP
jgi:hypothetical protein